MSGDKEAANFVGTIYDIRTKKDGGGRIQIDFGADGLEEVQWAQRLSALRGCAFHIVLVPHAHGAVPSKLDVEEIDPETGEVLLTQHPE